MRRIARRVTQLAALALVVVAPALGLWGVAAENHYDPAELALRYSEPASVLGPIADTLLGTPTDAAPGTLVGGAFSVRFFGFELADPLGLAALFGAGVAPPVGYLLGAVAVLVLHVLLGRWLCGWVCPYGILSRALSPLRRRLERHGLALDWQPPAATRWVLLGAVVVLPLVGISILPLALPYLAVTRSVHAIWFGSGAVAGWLVALLLSDLLLWDHGICRSVCPSGALQRLLGRMRVVRLGATKGVPCVKGCHACTRACWLGLDPRPGKVPDDCDACGRCTEVCPNTRIDLRWKRISSGAAALLMLGGCGQTPEVISATASWTSPFEALGSIPRTTTREYTRDGRVVSISTIEAERGLALRLYLEDTPGEAWTEPLTVAIENRAGRTELAFDRPTAPRSVRRPAQYEATVDPGGRAHLVFLDGPRSGERYPLNPASPPGPWIPGGLVLAAWGVGIVIVRVRTPRKR